MPIIGAKMYEVKETPKDETKRSLPMPRCNGSLELLEVQGRRNSTINRNYNFVHYCDSIVKDLTSLITDFAKSTL